MKSNTTNIGSKKTGSFGLALVALCIALFLTGCGMTDGTQSSQAAADMQSSTAQVQPAENAVASEASASDEENVPALVPTSSAANITSQSDIGVDKAKEAAITHAKLTADAVIFTKAKLDYDDGIQEYDIEFVSGGTKYEYEIKAADGTVLQFSQEAVEQLPPSNAASSASDGTIGLDAAKAAALTHAGFSADQVTFTKAKLDYDDGVMEYEIEFVADGKEYEVTIDAATGTITEYDVENSGRK